MNPSVSCFCTTNSHRSNSTFRACFTSKYDANKLLANRPQWCILHLQRPRTQWATMVPFLLFTLLALSFTTENVCAFSINGIYHPYNIGRRTGLLPFADLTNIYHRNPTCNGHRTTSYKNISTSEEDDANPISDSSSPPSNAFKFLTLYAPIWTSLAAIIGVTQTKLVSPLLGSLSVMQNSLAFLMLAMGLTITPKDLSRALQKPSVLVTNALYCFVMMPLVAVGMSKFFSYNTSEAVGIILLGSVSGGQASNLFTLLAGGDVALSVICTLSTTILGVIATPILVQFLLGCSVAVNGFEVLRSVTSLALLPLLIGLTLGGVAPGTVSRITHLCPPFGVLATMILVAGGAANSAGSLAVDQVTAITASCILPIVGGGLALALTSNRKFSEKTKRAVVIETLSKSPTLAYVLARKHFDSKTAAIPAAAMVSLAIIGATVSSIWSAVWPVKE
jgi:BASS family bile acid:Na+ symporter